MDFPIAKVPASRAIAWYAEAMRLWKRGPFVHCALGAITIVSQVLLELWPEVGPLVSKVVVPLIACGMLYAAAASEAGATPRLLHAFSAFRASASAIGAVVVSSAITFAVEWIAADQLADANLLRPAMAPAIDATTVLEIYAAGIVASLPLSFVPLEALFGGAGFGRSFVVSFVAFLNNAGAFLMYGVGAFALLAMGLLTWGFGLVIALPLIACATWAAWRDLCSPTPSPPA